MSIEPKEIGRRIAAAREAKHWSQMDLAYKFGVSPSSISRWERASPLPLVKTLIALAELLEIDPERLVEVSPPETAQIRAVQADFADLRRLVEEIHRAVVL